MYVFLEIYEKEQRMYENDGWLFGYPAIRLSGCSRWVFGNSNIFNANKEEYL